MVVEYPVKIKFNYDESDLKKVKEDLEVDKGNGKKGGGNSKTTGLLTGMLGKLGVIAAVLAALNNLIKPLLDAIQYLVFFAFALLLAGIKKIIDGVKSVFSKEFWKAIWEGIKERAIGLWEAIKEAFEPIKNAGIWIWNNIIKPAWEFLKDVGLWIWEFILLPAWEFLKDVGIWIWEQIIKPAWEFLLDVGKWIWEQIIKPAWAFIKNVGKWIWQQIIKPAFNFLKEVGKWIWEQIILPAFSFLSDVGMKIWNNIIKPAFSFLKDMGKWIWDIIKSSLGGLFGRGKGNRAFGGTVGETGLYKLHAGETVSRGNTTSVSNAPNITVNIAGGSAVSDEMIDQLVSRLTTELNAYTKW
jgi:hypothetical protein